jgi:hypothetical protein
MKDLIKNALADAFINLNKQIPTTKKKVVIVNLDDKGVKPINLKQFMIDNNIPDDAYFHTEEYNTLGGDVEVCLAYTIDVPTTEKDKLKFKKDKFRNIAWKYVFDTLISNGYKRVGCYSSEFKEFDDTTVYDMYINKEFDRLTKYYSLSFKKIELK